MGANTKPVAVLSASVAGVAVDDRVVQPAGVVHDRRGAVALAVHLVQPAGLEARRHEEDVGAGLDLVGQAFVVADCTATRPGFARASARNASCNAASPEPSTASCAGSAQQIRPRSRATRSSPF